MKGRDDLEVLGVGVRIISELSLENRVGSCGLDLSVSETSGRLL
jgi:hypothetical protein